MGKSTLRWILSGGIGSGKSEVRRMLSGHGVRTIDADSVGHEVLAGPARGHVLDRWPEVEADGAIDRAALGRVVFADPSALAELESITHPLIFGTILDDLQGFDEVAVVEMPLLNSIEGWQRMVVDAPDDDRLARVVGRGMSEADARIRLQAQPPREAWLASADLIIPNRGTLAELQDTVKRLVPALV